MNKIYNNLNIENLMKTGMFNQFNEFQQEEIIKGLEENLDVSLYAKKEFEVLQMSEIRLGLIDNLDVSKYANSEIPWQKMKEIRLELLKKSTLK